MSVRGSGEGLPRTWPTVVRRASDDVGNPGDRGRPFRGNRGHRITVTGRSSLKTAVYGPLSKSILCTQRTHTRTFFVYTRTRTTNFVFVAKENAKFQSILYFTRNVINSVRLFSRRVSKLVENGTYYALCYVDLEPRESFVMRRLDYKYKSVWTTESFL